MPATFYKLWSGGWGNPIGRGVMDARHVGIAGLAKAASANHPFAVVNELVCGGLARALLLPVPPGFLLEKDNLPYYVSLNFNLAGHELPPADGGAIATNHPELAVGIVVFDMWILNADRHPANIAYESARDKVALFDHSHALLPGPRGAAYLVTRGDEPVVSARNHCIAAHVRSLASLPDWLLKVESIPEFYVRGLFDAATGVGLPPGDAAICADFMLARRTRLVALIEAARDQIFPNAEQDLLEGAVEQPPAEKKADAAGGEAA